MQTNPLVKKNKEKVSFIINAIIDMIKNPDTIVNSSAYFYRPNEKNTFIVYLYLFKLLILIIFMYSFHRFTNCKFK